ncbi:MAG TPA: methyltransferase domain-containing protein [Puia sp.]|jgi:2-polyprenyl-3-methyl-5-hydroxy-6-metoxy-1,4-benzoquinol methylase
MAGKPDFSQRSHKKELLDRDDIPFADIERNMLELDFINTWLGGHAISQRGLKDLIGAKSFPFQNKVLLSGDPVEISVCEIGCGGGDNLRAMSRWCQKRDIKVDVTGIDINADCIKVAKDRWQGGSATWIHSDYRDVVFEKGKPDFLFSSLFCHHFTDDELVVMLQWMQEHAGSGWFINDLHRHRLAWSSIRLLTSWFSRSYLVKNDAPLSVLRGFSRTEWKRLLGEAGIGEYSVQWKWAFRWLVESKICTTSL